jgi:hypothetical protein
MKTELRGNTEPASIPRPAPHYLIATKSEEEARTNLHDALPGFAENSAEGGVAHIVVHLVVISVVKDVLRLQANLEVS